MAPASQAAAFGVAALTEPAKATRATPSITG